MSASEGRMSVQKVGQEKGGELVALVEERLGKLGSILNRVAGRFHPSVY